MKKIFLFILPLVIFTACGNAVNKEDSTMKSSHSKNSESTASTSEAKAKAVFTGKLAENASQNDTQDRSLRLILKNVKAVEDPENIGPMMVNDGVILNIAEDQLAKGTAKDDMRAGDTIQFTTDSMVPMTASIPPQIPGMAVLSVEKIRK